MLPPIIVDVMVYSDKMQNNIGGGGSNIFHSQTISYKKNEHFKRIL